MLLLATCCILHSRMTKCETEHHNGIIAGAIEPLYPQIWIPTRAEDIRQMAELVDSQQWDTINTMLGQRLQQRYANFLPNISSETLQRSQPTARQVYCRLFGLEEDESDENISHADPLKKRIDSVHEYRHMMTSLYGMQDAVADDSYQVVSLTGDDVNTLRRTQHHLLEQERLAAFFRDMDNDGTRISKVAVTCKGIKHAHSTMDFPLTDELLQRFHQETHAVMAAFDIHRNALEAPPGRTYKYTLFSTDYDPQLLPSALGLVQRIIDHNLETFIERHPVLGSHAAELKDRFTVHTTIATRHNPNQTDFALFHQAMTKSQLHAATISLQETGSHLSDKTREKLGMQEISGATDGNIIDLFTAAGTIRRHCAAEFTRNGLHEYVDASSPDTLTLACFADTRSLSPDALSQKLQKRGLPEETAREMTHLITAYTTIVSSPMLLKSFSAYDEAEREEHIRKHQWYMDTASDVINRQRLRRINHSHAHLLGTVIKMAHYDQRWSGKDFTGDALDPKALDALVSTYPYPMEYMLFDLKQVRAFQFFEGQSYERIADDIIRNRTAEETDEAIEDKIFAATLPASEETFTRMRRTLFGILHTIKRQEHAFPLTADSSQMACAIRGDELLVIIPQNRNGSSLGIDHQKADELCGYLAQDQSFPFATRAIRGTVYRDEAMPEEEKIRQHVALSDLLYASGIQITKTVEKIWTGPVGPQVSITSRSPDTCEITITTPHQSRILPKEAWHDTGLQEQILSEMLATEPRTPAIE